MREKVAKIARLRKEPSQSVLVDIVGARQTDIAAEYKCPTGPGWKRTWKQLSVAAKKKMAKMASAWNITVAEMMMLSLHDAFGGGAVIPAYAALEEVTGDSSAIRQVKKDLRVRLLAAAKGVTVPAYELMRLGVRRVCEEFEATGSLRFGPAPEVEVSPNGDARAAVLKSVLGCLSMLEVSADEKVRGAARVFAEQLRAGDTALIVREDHAAIYCGAAKIAGMEVQDLLDLLLGQHTRDLSDRENGLMDGVVDGMAPYASRAEKHKAIARLMAWLGGEPMDTSPHPKSVRLTVNADQSRALTEIADMMEVSPWLFLQWVLEYEIENLNDPRDGSRSAWVNELLVYETPEEEARVQARLAAWEKSAPAKKSDKPAAKYPVTRKAVVV